MLIDADYTNPVVYDELMKNLDIVQQVTLRIPRDTSAEQLGYIVPADLVDSSAREVVITDASRGHLDNLGSFVQNNPVTAVWPNPVKIHPRSLVVGLDPVEHALDLDAEIATTEFAKTDSLRDAYADIYEDIEKLLK